MGTAGLLLANFGMSAFGKTGSGSASSGYLDAVEERPVLLDAPEDDGSGGTDNASMEAERQKELQRAALRRQQAREVFTSGLGAAGMATTSKKTLLGE